MTTVRPFRADDRAAVAGLDSELQQHERRLRPSRARPEAVVDANLDRLDQRLADPDEHGSAFVTVDERW